jgi:hypothetical protein
MPNPTTPSPEPSSGSADDASTRSTPDTTPASSPDAPRPAAGTGDSGDTSRDAGDPDAGDQEPVEPTPEYVARLRREAAEHRRGRRAAEAELTELREYRMRVELERHAAPRMANVEDLLTFRDAAELLDDAGRPDPERIRAAVDGLLRERPYLGPRPRTGSGDGGSCGAAVEPTLTIGGAIRRAARGEPD